MYKTTKDTLSTLEKCFRNIFSCVLPISHRVIFGILSGTSHKNATWFESKIKGHFIILLHLLKT